MGSKRQGPTLPGLPVEILGRILECLPDQERWQTTPLICKALSMVHEAYPPKLPKRREWLIQKPLSEGLLGAFLVYAPSLAVLKLWGCGNELLPDMFAIAASKAPMLKALDIMTGATPSAEVLSSVYNLGQLTELRISQFPFPDNGSLVEILGIKRLHFLQELELHGLHWSHATVEQIKSFWGALAVLRKLETVKLEASWTNELPKGPHRSVILQQVSLLTQIRFFEMHGLEYIFNTEELLLLTKSLRQLLQLTDMDIGRVPAAILPSVMALPCLTSLDLDIVGNYQEQISLLPESPLQRLYIQGNYQKVDGLLYQAAPGLQSLEQLTLSFNSKLSNFPESLADVFRHLKLLSLSYCAFERIPQEVTRLTKLISLNLVGNETLQLEMGDILIISALPNLQHLSLEKKYMGAKFGGYSPKSIEVFHSWSDRLSHLALTA